MNIFNLTKKTCLICGKKIDRASYCSYCGLLNDNICLEDQNKIKSEGLEVVFPEFIVKAQMEVIKEEKSHYAEARAANLGQKDPSFAECIFTFCFSYHVISLSINIKKGRKDSILAEVKELFIEEAKEDILSHYLTEEVLNNGLDEEKLDECGRSELGPVALRRGLRLKKLIELHASEPFIRNEKRMLQEAVEEQAEQEFGRLLSSIDSINWTNESESIKTAKTLSKLVYGEDDLTKGLFLVLFYVPHFMAGPATFSKLFLIETCDLKAPGWK